MIIERRKLFSSDVPPMPRRKLFSTEEQDEHKHEESGVDVICSDCGYGMKTHGTTNMICPKCGSTRFNVSNRKSLFESDFQKELKEAKTPLEKKLKEFSGREIGKDLFEKEFSNICTLDDLEERGYAVTNEDGGIRISDSAFLESRIFSKIIVSVTKEFDLVPDIMMGGDKSEYINNLDATPKCIAILKKVHGIRPEGEAAGWLEDSGVLKDLPAEFGDTKMPKEKFEKIIETRYPDAPEDLLDKLKALGIIRSGEDNNIIEIK